MLRRTKDFRRLARDIDSNFRLLATGFLGAEQPAEILALMRCSNISHAKIA
jgi:hypothetical protein